MAVPFYLHLLVRQVLCLKKENETFGFIAFFSFQKSQGKDYSPCFCRCVGWDFELKFVLLRLWSQVLYVVFDVGPNQALRILILFATSALKMALHIFAYHLHLKVSHAVCNNHFNQAPLTVNIVNKQPQYGFTQCMLSSFSSSLYNFGFIFYCQDISLSNK